MELITKDKLNAQSLMSELLRTRTKKPAFKPPYADGSVAAESLFYAVQVEVETRGGQFDVDDALNKRLTQIGNWLVDTRSCGLFMCGNTGSGKTTVLDALINLYSTHRFTHKGVGVGFQRIEATELYQQYKYHYPEFESTKQCPMLAIDDLGIEPVYINVFGTDISPISELLYYRYQRQLLTVITTNLHQDEIRGRYGDRIADRFKEMMTTVVFANPSYRGQKSKAQNQKPKDNE